VRGLIKWRDQCENGSDYDEGAEGRVHTCEVVVRREDERKTTRKTARFMKDLRTSVEAYFEILPVEARGRDSLGVTFAGNGKSTAFMPDKQLLTSGGRSSGIKQ